MWSRVRPVRSTEHGATATTAMTHIAIVEQLDGKTVDWMEKLSDREYEKANSDRERKHI